MTNDHYKRLEQSSPEPNYKDPHPDGVPHPAKQRAKALLDESGIDKYEWCKLTGFSEGQYYRWMGNGNSRTLATARQVMHICEVFDWSPTYIYFGIGPARLSEVKNTDLAAGIDVAISTNLLVKEMMGMLKAVTFKDEEI